MENTAVEFVNNNIMSLMEGVNITWILLGAALVFFMQAGFAMVETGFTRAKNAGNIIMKNLMDFSIGTPFYWLVGFGIMFGSSSAFFGVIDFFSGATIAENGFQTLIFQTVFCATAATIVSGAMAERTKFSSYCIYSAMISLIIYPVSGHWIWAQSGFLYNIGFHDFAGSTAVHMVGGVAALVGAKILGPRIGKYSKSGKPHAIPGHSITLGALGVFILWFCWFGFNGCSTVAMTSAEESATGLVVSSGPALLASKIFVTTNLAAACATCTTMLFTWVRYKKPDVSMTLNGTLAGLVAITAGCDVVNPWAAAVIGVIAGFAVVIGIEFVDKVCKIDDPVGAIGVHGVNGALGTILTGVFISNDDLAARNMDRLQFIGIQCIGVLCVMAWVAVTMTIVFQILKHTIGLRVSREEEISGLDLPEHGLVNAYADFAPSIENLYYNEEDATPEVTGSTPMNEAVPVELVTETDSVSKPIVASDTKITKVEIICKQASFDALKNSLMSIGITGMTVTNVLGCGAQKGKPEYYRGVIAEATLLPKVQVEVVVCKVPVRKLIDAAKKSLYTGHIGDGKIFVYDVESVIKVRTGEEGCDALQDVE